MPNNEGATGGAARRSILKVPTGIRGLDKILNGGLPRGRTVMVNGGAGTGKTVLAMEFLYRGACAGEPGLFFSFEERAEDLRDNAASMGMDLAGLEAAGKLKVIHAPSPHNALRVGEFDLQGLLAMIDGHIRALKAERIVLDAVDMLLRLFNEPERERTELYQLNDWLRARGLTTLLTVKTMPEQRQIYPFLDFMADCVLRLDQRMHGQVATRRLTVTKYRGSGFMSNEHPYVVSDKGISMIPVSSMSLVQRISSEQVSTGNDTLDAILNGGFRVGSSILVAGPSGSGKTTLACTFIRAAVGRDERVLYVHFEESREALAEEMRSVGIELAPMEEAGALRILTMLPESAGIEQHLLRILDALNDHQPRHIVVDAVSAFRRMDAEARTLDFLIRLLTACKERGITSLFTNQLNDPVGEMTFSGVGISSLVDAFIGLQYRDDGRSLERQLLVVKARGINHSMRYHALSITDDGLRLHLPEAAQASPDASREGSR